MKRFLAALAAVALAWAPLAHAADVKTSGLPAASALAGTDLVAVSQGTCPGVAPACQSVKATAAQIATYAAGSSAMTAAYQPLDSDLTSIAGLTTTSFGRGLLTQADASASRTTLGLAIGTNVQAWDADLDAVAALSTTSYGRSLLTQASATAARSTLGLRRLYPSGRWLVADGVTSVTGTSVAPGANSLRLYPGVVREPLTIVGLAARVTTAAASSNVQFCVYGSDATTLMPTGAAIYATGSLSSAATGIISDTSLVQAVGAGLIWWGVNTDSGTVVLSSLSTTGLGTSVLVGGASAGAVLGAGNGVVGLSKAQTLGSCPTLTGNATTDGLSDVATASIPLIAFKAQ